MRSRSKKCVLSDPLAAVIQQRDFKRATAIELPFSPEPQRMKESIFDSTEGVAEEPASPPTSHKRSKSAHASPPPPDSPAAHLQASLTNLKKHFEKEGQHERKGKKKEETKTIALSPDELDAMLARVKEDSLAQARKENRELLDEVKEELRREFRESRDLEEEEEEEEEERDHRDDSPFRGKEKEREVSPENSPRKKKRKRKHHEDSDDDSSSTDETPVKRHSAELDDSRDRREAAIALAKSIASAYVDYGKKDSDYAPLMKELPPNEVCDTVLRALGRQQDGRFVSHTKMMTSSQRKNVPLLQDEFAKVVLIDQRPEAVRFVLRRVFGLPVPKESISAWEMFNLLSIMKHKCNTSMTMIKDEIQRFIDIEKELRNPPGYRANLKDAKGERLTQARMTDIARFPAKWREFVAFGPDVGRNRRELITELDKRYVHPLRAIRSKANKGVIGLILEAEDSIKEIDAIITPQREKESKETDRLLEWLLLFKVEKLESLRLIATQSYAVANEFLEKVRKTSPSTDKDLEKFATDAIDKKGSRAETPASKKGLHTAFHMGAEAVRRDGTRTVRHPSGPPHQKAQWQSIPQQAGGK